MNKKHYVAPKIDTVIYGLRKSVCQAVDPNPGGMQTGSSEGVQTQDEGAPARLYV